MAPAGAPPVERPVARRAANDPGRAGRSTDLTRAATTEHDVGTVIVAAPVIADLRRAVEEILSILRGSRKPLLTVEEVARAVGRTPYTVRRWITEGRLHATRVAGTGPKGRLLVARGELDRLIEQGLAERLPDALA